MMNMQPIAMLPPSLFRHKICEKQCGGTYGPFTACKGVSSPENRGRIMQQCCNKACHHTLFHTEAYSSFANATTPAEHFNKSAPPLPVLNQHPPHPPPYLFYQYLTGGQSPHIAALPPQLCPPPPHPALPSVKSKVKITCEGPLCRSTRKPSPGSNGCLFKRCARCCDTEFERALGRFVHRECAGHANRVVQKQPLLPIPANPEAVVVADPLHAATPTPIASAAPIQVCSPISPEPALHPAVVPAETDGIRKKLTAHSVSPLWAHRVTEAITSSSAAKEVKVDQRLLASQHHRRVTVIIWEKDNVDPFRFPAHIDTFPQFTLRGVQGLMQALSIQPNDFLATWDSVSGGWEWHTCSTPRVVGAGQRLLYKYTRICAPNLLPDTVCNGLSFELAQQEKA
ncbi:hypothetical protein K439DRAFT_1665200, partial [Ramaria rubella]